jgi:hypothetical protein
MSNTPEPLDPKEKFKAALEKRKSQNAGGVKKGASEGSSKLQASSGNKPKLFRRKSG